MAALLLALALAPGLPALPFLVVAMLVAAAAVASAWRRRAGPAASAAADLVPGPEAPFAPPSPVSIELGPDLLRLAGQAGLAPSGIASLRADLWHSLGVRLPAVAVRPAAEAEGSSYRVLIDEIPVHRGRVPLDEVLVLAPPDDLVLVGIPSRPAPDPISGRPSAVVGRGDAKRAAALGRVREPPDRLLAEVAGALRRHAHHLIGVQDVQCLLDDLEPTAPALVREVTRQLSSSTLAEVLRRLVEEGVSIRPLRVILESILQAGAAGGAAPLTEACRRALRGQLGHAHAAGGPLSVLLLDPTAEQAIREALAGEMLALEPRRAVALLDALAAELCGHPSPPVVLVSPDVRRAVRSLFAPRFPRLPVLAFEELPPELPVRPVGRIGATW